MSKRAKAKFDILKANLTAQGKLVSTDLQLFDYLAYNITDDLNSVQKIIKNKTDLKIPIQKKAKKIKIVLTDVDGVLTDGGRYYTKMGKL